MSSLMVDRSHMVEETVVARGIEKSVQLADIYKKYPYDVAIGTHGNIYDRFREGIDFHLRVEKRMKQLKAEPLH